MTTRGWNEGILVDVAQQLAAKTLEKLRLLQTMGPADLHNVLAQAEALAKVGVSISR